MPDEPNHRYCALAITAAQLAVTAGERFTEALGAAVVLALAMAHEHGEEYGDDVITFSNPRSGFSIQVLRHVDGMPLNEVRVIFQRPMDDVLAAQARLAQLRKEGETP